MTIPLASFRAKKSSELPTKSPATESEDWKDPVELVKAGHQFEDPPTIVFSSRSQYHPVIVFLMSVAPLSIIVSIFLVLRDPSVQDSEREQGIRVLVCTLTLVFGMYCSILPKQVDVRSNGSIGVKTILFTYQFTGVLRAFEAGLGREDFLRPRIKFATSTNNRVIVRRRHGKWDILVTPEDPQGYVRAIEEVVARIEDEQHGVIEKREGGIPDLASV